MKWWSVLVLMYPLLAIATILFYGPQVKPWVSVLVGFFWPVALPVWVLLFMVAQLQRTRLYRAWFFGKLAVRQCGCCRRRWSYPVSRVYRQEGKFCPLCGGPGIAEGTEQPDYHFIAPGEYSGRLQ